MVRIHQIQVFFTMFIVSSGQREPADVIDNTATDPKCKCPEGVTWSDYCGYELKELNSKASKKVEQTNCEDNSVYLCTKPMKASDLSKKCHHTCVQPSEEIKAKYNYLSTKRVAPDFRWCIDPSEPGLLKLQFL